MKNHYDTLNVSGNATKEEIKNSYRSLSLRYHPDRHYNSGGSSERFKQISEAYSILSNDKQRKLYDLDLAEWRRFGRVRRRNSNARSGSSSQTSSSSGPFPFHNRPSSSSYHLNVLEGIFKPRNAFIGLTLGFMTVSAIRSLHSYYDSLLQQQREEEQEQQHHRDLLEHAHPTQHARYTIHRDEGGKKKYVEAWYNQQTQSWETPAPWSSTFRELNPKIHMIPREQVKSSSQHS